MCEKGIESEIAVLHARRKPRRSVCIISIVAPCDFGPLPEVRRQRASSEFSRSGNFRCDVQAFGKCGEFAKLELAEKLILGTLDAASDLRHNLKSRFEADVGAYETPSVFEPFSVIWDDD